MTAVPLLDRPQILWTALAYLVLVSAIGLWAARRTRDSRDFFIAGQRIGLVVTALATMSAAFSGFVFLGGPGLTYRLGVGSFFICASVSFTGGMLCWAVGKRLRLLAGLRDVLTVPDAVQARYGGRAAAGLAALAVLLGSVAYLGAQIQALGVVVEAVFGLDRHLGAAAPATAMALGLAVVLFYSVAGGMVAGVYTDLVQGVLMTGAAAAVFYQALAAGGGLAGITRQIATSESFGSAFLEPLGTLPTFTALGFFFVFSVGTLGQPHMLHKFYMIDDPEKLRWMPLVLSFSQTVCILLWMGIGLAVPALVAGGRLAPLANPDEAAPAFLLAFVPPALAGLVFAAILAAIMSTADSFLNIAAAALVRDLPRALGRRGTDRLGASRWAVVAVALAAALFAHLYGDLIALLGTFAFGTFAAALTPALVVGLAWNRVPRSAAIASIATGLLANIGLELARRADLAPLGGLLPSAAALLLSFTVLFAGTALVGWRSSSLPQIAAALRGDPGGTTQRR